MCPRVFCLFRFFQKNFILNGWEILFDLVFRNSNFFSVVASFNPIVPPDLYHLPLLILCSSTFNLPPFNNSHSFYNCRWVNYPSIIKFIFTFDWISTFSTCDVNCAVNLLIDALHIAFLILFLLLLSLVLAFRYGLYLIPHTFSLWEALSWAKIPYSSKK